MLLVSQAFPRHPISKNNGRMRSQFVSAIFPIYPWSLTLCVGKRESASASPAPRDFTLVEDDTQVKLQVGNEGGEQVSAADYDPSLDRREDEQKRIWNPAHAPESVEELEEEEEEVDDMFAVAAPEKQVKKLKRMVVSIITHCR
jgi:hypothetical protein